MIKGIRALYAKLTDTNAKLCCLCYNHVNEESSCVQDFVVLGPNCDDDTIKSSTEEEVDVHYILEQILGREVAAYLSDHDPICNECMLSAISSYKFIKSCKRNFETMAYSVEVFTDNLEHTEGINIQDYYNTMFITLMFEKSEYIQYYDIDKFADSNAALYRFQTQFRPYRIIRSNKGNTIYKCTKCKSVFRSHTGALKHFTVKHTKDQEINKDEIKNCSDNDNDICTGDINDTLSAPNCPKRYDRDNIRRFNELSHEVITDCYGVNKYKCKVCALLCSSAENARRHYKKRHIAKSGTEKETNARRKKTQNLNSDTDKTKTKKKKPDYLTEFNYCRDNIKHLNEISHTVIKDSSGATKYKCKECESVLSTTHNARNHFFKYHVEETKFEEDSDSKGEDSKIDTKSEKINNEDKHTCVYCHEIFSNKYILIEHILKKHASNNSESNETTLKDIHLLENDIYKHIYTKEGDESGSERFCCKICLKLFMGYQSVRRHFNIFHLKPQIEEERYICSQCGMRLKTKSLLSKHEDRHANTKICETCNGDFKNIHSFKVHKKSGTEKETNAGYKKTQNLTSDTDKTKTKKIKPDYLTVFNYCRDNIKHLNEISHTVINDSSGATKYKCNECESVLSSTHSARNHFFKYHVEETKFEEDSDSKGDDSKIETKSEKISNEDKHTCIYCHEIYSNKYILIEHILKKHARKNSEICNETILKDIHLLENDIYKHIYTKEQDESGCERFCCKICLKLFMGYQSVRRHFNFFHLKPQIEEERYICSQCGMRLKTKSLLSKHEDRHANTKICETCNGQFKNIYSFKVHNCCYVRKKRLLPMMRDDSQREFFCNDCGKKYRTKAALRGHINLTHNPKAQKFPCLLCPKVFSQRYGLKFHQVTHTRERNFTCEICGDVFVAKNALQYHTRIHTGERPYKCNFCEMRFLNSSRRADHVRRHHIAAMATCTVCGITVKEAGLRKHIRRHATTGIKKATRSMSHVPVKRKRKSSDSESMSDSDANEC